MGKILEYGNLGAPPADNDLLFMGDYSLDASNPTTKRLAISDLNKKRNVDAADGNGLMLRDDGGNYGIFIKDGGNVGIGTNAPDYELDISGATDPTIGITAGAAGDAVIRFDQTTTQQATIGYDDTGDLLKFNNNSNFGGTSHLVINSDGNVGVGVANPTVSLDVSGDFEIVDGSYGIKIDASLGNIEGITSVGASGPLHLNRSAGEDIWFMYTSGTDFAGKVESTNKRWSIGSVSTPSAKLDIKEAAGATTPVLRLQNSSSGTVRTLLQLTNGSDNHYLVWDGTTFGINNDGDALGAASINFQGSSTHGKVGINAAVGTRVLEATETAGQGIVAALQSTSSGNGSKLLFRSTTNSTSVDQSQGLAFTNTISSEIMTWFAGAFRPSGAGSTHYFALNYTGSAVTGGDSIYKINDTLALNAMYLDESGNVRFKGTMEASAYYDQGGNSAGNYCRGRFVQMFSFPFQATYSSNDRYGPMFNAPRDTTNNHTDNITKAFATKAPAAGRILRIDLTVEASEALNLKPYIFSGNTTALNALGGSLTTSNSADYNGTAYGTSQLEITNPGTGLSTDFTIGYDDFDEKATYLDFDQGDFLVMMMNTSTGNADINITVTVEFNIPDATLVP